jgi:hypothetical protein
MITSQSASRDAMVPECRSVATDSIAQSAFTFCNLLAAASAFTMPTSVSS